MRKDFTNMKVKDIPQPNQRWKVKGDLVKIMGVRTSVHGDKPGEWFVDWYYINDDGTIHFRANLTKGPAQVCDGTMELGRFLHIATKEKQ